MHNKRTYTRVLTYAYTLIDIRVYAYRHTRIHKIRAYNTRIRSSDISELHCSHFDRYKHQGLQHFYAYYGIAWGTRKLVMDGNTNASERGESEGGSLCGDLDQDK